MFHEDAKILAARSHKKRNENLTPTQRSEIATKASYSRWYKVSDEQLDRINSYLRGLALVAAKAQAEHNDEKYVRAITAMGQYERMKLMIEGNRSREAKPVEELTELDEGVVNAVKAFREGKGNDVIDVTPEGKKK